MCAHASGRVLASPPLRAWRNSTLHEGRPRGTRGLSTQRGVARARWARRGASRKIWRMVRVIAHRGASAEAPENTLRALALAREQGAHAAEIDVRRTADDRVVVFHDRDLKRLCGARGVMRRLPLEALREHRVAGEPIPTLEELLASEARPAGLVVELKSDRWNDVRIAALAAKAIRKAGAAAGGAIVVSSFNPFCLLTLRRVAPELPRALLAHGHQPLPGRRLWARRAVGASELHLERRMITPTLVRWAHAGGRRVVAWTVNDPAEARALADMGVDGLITDAPAAVTAALDGAGAKA